MGKLTHRQIFKMLLDGNERWRSGNRNSIIHDSGWRSYFGTIYFKDNEKKEVGFFAWIILHPLYKLRKYMVNRSGR